MSYDDGTTPGLSYTYDRRGRQATVTQNGITDTLGYNDANLPLGEAYTSGLLGGLSVTNGYDQYLRRNSLSLASGQSTLQTINYGYDNASRLQTVTDNTGSPAYSATYSYLDNSPLVSKIVFKQATTPRMTTTKQYDYLNRLSSISSSSSPSISSSYAYNSANQRIRSTLADGSYWLYEYDSLGQVSAGRKYWSDQTPVAGQQFDYTFDTIGNRTQTQAGGEQNGANLRTASYSADNLNRYSSRDVPGAVDVMGLGFATNAVTVNGQTAYRKGEYFRKEVPVSNGSVPVWQSVTNAASGQTSITGNVFVPKTQEQFGYDADGNLTSDGRWKYGWDGENRLVTLTTNTPVGPQQSIKFEYDWKGRRIHKQVWSNALWSGTPTNDVKFVYDGWNLIAEMNVTNSAVIRSNVWGLDLSGSTQGAGGVGGLLFIGDFSSGIGYCAPAYDGNGNVAALVSMSGGTNCATYEYGPFGEVIRATGPMAKANPFRFSTKYQDDETDLLYYGRRHYNSSTGRWLSRDPIEESGGLNIYAFVDNAPVRKVDIHGLAWKELETVDTVTGMTRRSFVGATDKENKVGTFIYPRRGACGCWRRNVYADFTPTLTITYQQYTETQKFEDDFSPTADALETAHQLELLVDALTGEGIGVATLFMSLLTGVETGLATHQDTVYITVTADYEKALRDKDAVSWSMSTTYFKKGEGKNISSTTCKPKLTMLNAAQIRSLESGLTQDYSRSGAMPWDLSTDPVRLTHPKVTVSN